MGVGRGWAITTILAVSLLLATVAARADQASVGRQVLLGKCQACHEPLADGGLNRISQIRKSPEGWDMVITRMRLWHGVQVSADEQRALVAYLAGTQGLAPSEAAPFRYVLERRPDFIEANDPELTDMCGRCHTLARVGLQHRDAPEWTKLAHMHLGQFPTIEYSALGRDRNWWEIASTQMPTVLGKRFPFQTEAWSAWQKAPKKSPEGLWRIAGHQPGKRAFAGTVALRRDGAGYKAHFALAYDDGRRTEGDGAVVVYTGYEWRGRTQFGKVESREVFALAPDGNSFSGRFYQADADEIGGRMQGVRADGPARVLAVFPDHLKSGTAAKLAVVGVGLKGDPDLGPGVTIKRVVSASPQQVVVEAETAADAAPGARDVKIGATWGAQLVVYSKLDSVRVEPDYAVARVGGGHTPPVTAQFEAIGYLNGPDGKPGTDDDVRVGVFPAAWSTANNGPAADRMQDTRFAGQMSEAGLFLPAKAGPNPARPFHTNNGGDLGVIAKVGDDPALTGKGRLIVTVQRWVDPPIR